MTQYVFRKESFGSTVFNPTTLNHFFLNQEQTATLASLYGQPGKIVQGPAIQAFPSNQDYSEGQFQQLLEDLKAGYSLDYKRSPEPYPDDSLTAPIRIYFEINLSCNGRCKYCLNRAGSERPNALSYEEKLQTIEKLGEEGVFETRLTGGEISLESHCMELARSVKRSGMALSMNSNLLVGRKTLEDFASLEPSLLITSLDANKQAHAENRGDGFDTIVENVRYLRQCDVPVRLNCMFNQSTLQHIESFIDRFAPLGCGFCFILTRPVGRAGDDFSPPPLKDLVSAVQLIDTKQSEYPEVYFNTSFHVVKEKEFSIGKIQLTGCNAIQRSFNVNSDGSILPCAFLYELSQERFTLGNIRDHAYSVLPIWRKSQLLRSLRQRSAECNLRCIGCDRFKRQCRGTCIFMELYSELTGRPDPYCQKSLEAVHN